MQKNLFKSKKVLVYTDLVQLFTKMFRDKENLGIKFVIDQFRRLAGTIDSLVWNCALLGFVCSGSADNENILPIEDCIMRVSTIYEIAGIGPFAHFNIESTDSVHYSGIRESTKQVKRAVDVKYWGLFNILSDLYRGSKEKL